MKPHPPNPTCPRCGYDQSGEVAAWTDRCPTEGLCPECATVFSWSDIFDPSRQDIRWLVEHAASTRSRLRRTGPTLLKMVRPWVFWRLVDVHRRTQPGNLLAWLPAIIVLSHLLAWMPVLWLTRSSLYHVRLRNVHVFIAERGWLGIQEALVTGLLWPAGWIHYGVLGYNQSWNFMEPGIMMLGLSVGYGVTWFVLLGCLPTTRCIAKVRTAHLVRALLLQFGVVAIAVQILRIFEVLWRNFLPITNTRGIWEIVLLVPVSIVSLWSIAWWGCAAWIGWRIRSRPLLAFAGMAGLVGGLLVYTILHITLNWLATPV